MSEININTLNSGDYPDLIQSVYTVSGNKVLLDNISNFYNFRNLIQLPMHFLRKYENIIKSNLVKYRIDSSRFFRPEYVSYDLYNTTDLWYLILFVNDLKDPLELNYPDILVPNSLYITEIINKLKSLDMVKYTHDDPISINRVLLKDINESSDKIIKEENVFIPTNYVKFQPYLDNIYNPYFTVKNYKLSRDIFYEVNNDNWSKESFVNHGFVPDTNITIPFNVMDGDSHKMFINKKLKTNEKYYLLKRYCGKMNLVLKNESTKVNKTILNNEENEMSPTILTYDLREATFSPEYLKEYLILEHDGTIYEPKIFTNTTTNEEYYGIEINKVKYPIYYDGTCYYIIVGKDEDNNDLIELLENKEGITPNHSMNEWLFNNNPYPNIKLENLTESNLFFHEDYSKVNGEYVYNLTFNKLNYTKNINMAYRIDINRDLKSNDNKLKKYAFLGFEFEVKISKNQYCSEIKDHLNISPLVIEIISNELDSDGNNIHYKYSYPDKVLYSDNITNETTDSLTMYSDFCDQYGSKLYKFKRIIPIIKDLETKELIDIKEILVYPEIKLSDSFHYTISNFEINISCGTLKIFGLNYDSIVTAFKTPETNEDYLDYIIEYDYTTKGTKYSNDYESTYFEPYIINNENNLMEILDDSYNLNYIIKNNLYQDIEFITLNQATENQKPIFKLYDKEDEDHTEVLNNTDFHELIFKKNFNVRYQSNKFQLADTYILELKLYFKDVLGSFDNFEYFNKYNNPNNEKNCLHHNFQLLFDYDVENNNYYCINFGEPVLKTNNSNLRKTEPYINENKYLDNFNSNSFTVDTKENKDENSIFYKKFIHYTSNNTKNLIFSKWDNHYFSIPDGIYKSIIHEGTYKYRPYKYIPYLEFPSYQIKQTKTFSNHYFNKIQNPKHTIVNGLAVNSIVENNIYIQIKKLYNNYYIYYKFNENDDYILLHQFNDFYKIINNGTIGLRFFNTFPYNIELLDYQISE